MDPRLDFFDRKAGEKPLSCPDLQITVIEPFKKLVMSVQLNYFREIMANQVCFSEYGRAHKQLYHDSWEDKTQNSRAGIQNSFTVTWQGGIMAFKIKIFMFCILLL